MVKCPECGKEYDIPICEKEDKSCPDCGESLLKVLPGYPNRKGTGTRNTIKIAWDILKSNLKEIVVFLLVPTFILLIINSILFWQIIIPTFSDLTSNVNHVTRPEYSDIDLIKVLVAWIGFSFLYWIIQHTFMGGIIKMSRNSYIGRTVSPKKGLNVIKQRFFDLLGASFLISLFLMSGFFVSIFVGTEFCCFGVIGILVSVVLFIIILHGILFTLPILVLDDKSILTSISESRSLSRSRDGTFKFTIAILTMYYILNMTFFYLPSMAWSVSFFKTSIYHLILQIRLQGLVVFLQLLVLTFTFICITVHHLKIRRKNEKDIF